jgi:hypothetical protein
MLYVYAFVKPWKNTNFQRIAAKVVLWYWMGDVISQVSGKGSEFNFYIDILANGALFTLLIL